jgi:osmotically-inducible protein OsmY
MFFAALAILSVTLGCSSRPCANDIARKDAVVSALGKAGVTGVDVSEQVSQNIVTLTGTVSSENAKQEAGHIAQGAAGTRVVDNRILVEPAGGPSAVHAMRVKLDNTIEKNYQAVLIAKGLDKQPIQFNATDGVLVLKGRVKSRPQRSEAAQLAEAVPNVLHVVNQIEVR